MTRKSEGAGFANSEGHWYLKAQYLSKPRKSLSLLTTSLQKIPFYTHDRICIWIKSPPNAPKANYGRFSYCHIKGDKNKKTISDKIAFTAVEAEGIPNLPSYARKVLEDLCQLIANKSLETCYNFLNLPHLDLLERYIKGLKNNKYHQNSLLHFTENSLVTKYTTLFAQGFNIDFPNLKLQESSERLMEHCWEDKTGNTKHQQEFIDIGFVKDGTLNVDILINYAKKAENELKNGIKKYVVCNCTADFISYGFLFPLDQSVADPPANVKNTAVRPKYLQIALQRRRLTSLRLKCTYFPEHPAVVRQIKQHESYGRGPLPLPLDADEVDQLRQKAVATGLVATESAFDLLFASYKKFSKIKKKIDQLNEYSNVRLEVGNAYVINEEKWFKTANVNYEDHPIELLDEEILPKRFDIKVFDTL